MGNTSAKDFEERELGQAYLDSSSPKVIDSRCITNDTTRLVQKGNKKWYYVSKHDGQKEEFMFAIQKQRYFVGTTQVIVDEKDSILAVLQTTRVGKANKTLVYRPSQTFDEQEPTVEVYKEKERIKDHPKLYLFARIQSSGASKCDATYSLLQVHVVYNDPDFAKFQDPPLYRAAKVSGGMGGAGFAAAVMDGSSPGGETLLGKIRAGEAEIGNGVDIIATICLALSVNVSGNSARGVAKSGVV
jgi:hypothetical protein